MDSGDSSRLYEDLGGLLGCDDVDSVLAALTLEHVLPRLYSNLARPIAFSLLLTDDPRTLLLHSHLLFITGEISSQSLESVVYSAKIIPDSRRYHFTFDDGSRLLLEDGVDAAVKNTPLVPVPIWKDMLQHIILLRVYTGQLEKLRFTHGDLQPAKTLFARQPKAYLHCR